MNGGPHLSTYTDRFRVTRIAGWYRITDPRGDLLPQRWSCKKNAEAACQRAQELSDARNKRGPRPCLCCGRQFESAGIQNRLCSTCSARGDSGWVTAGSTTTGKVRRAASA